MFFFGQTIIYLNKKIGGASFKKPDRTDCFSIMKLSIPGNQAPDQKFFSESRLASITGTAKKSIINKWK